MYIIDLLLDNLQFDMSLKPAFKVPPLGNPWSGWLSRPILILLNRRFGYELYWKDWNSSSVPPLKIILNLVYLSYQVSCAEMAGTDFEKWWNVTVDRLGGSFLRHSGKSHFPGIGRIIVWLYDGAIEVVTSILILSGGAFVCSSIVGTPHGPVSLAIATTVETSYVCPLVACHS